MRQVSVDIHASAIVDPTAVIRDDVKIGPYAIVGPDVTIGQGSRIFAHAVIEGGTTIGERCQIHYGAVIGGEPQDLKYEGESTVCIVGDGTVIREYVTVSRGTRALGRTEIGEGCLLMAYVHVAHDCRIGDGVILSNAVNLAGHVTIDEQAIIGGMTPVHQFVRIGAHAFVGGGSRVQIEDRIPRTILRDLEARGHAFAKVGRKGEVKYGYAALAVVNAAKRTVEGGAEPRRSHGVAK